MNSPASPLLNAPPPLPSGYALDQNMPPLPSGYALDSPSVPQAHPYGTDWYGKAQEDAAKALNAAGLPSSIQDVPNWFQHLTGTAKDSKPWWNPIKEAIANPTQENIVAAIPFIGPASVAMAQDVREGNYGGAAATLAGTVASPIAAGEVAPGLNALGQQLKIPELAQGAAQKLYQSALKPSLSARNAPKIPSIVSTGLNYGIPVNEAGVEKLGDLIDDLNTKISNQIDAGQKIGQSVNKYAVTSRLTPTYADVSSQVNPEKAQAAVSRAGNEFLRSQPTDIPVQQAQEMKQGTYQQLRNSYGQLSSATVESQKALARGLKEELQQQFPQIQNLNAQEGKLIDLDSALDRAVTRISNHQLMGIGTPLAAAGAGAATGSPPMALASGVFKAILDDPVVKSKLAIALNRGSKGAIAVPDGMAQITALSGVLAHPYASPPDSDSNIPAPQGTP